MGPGLECNDTVEHIPVLAATLAEQINLPQDAVMVDATIGQGGHSFLFGQMFNSRGVIVGFDVDESSLRRAESKLKTLKCKTILIHSNFSEVAERLEAEGIEKVDLLLADLGVSSSQLSDAEKGLSFLEDMPLDMRIDQRIKGSAADIVNEFDEKSLADLIYKYGEDRASRRIARFIVQNRVNQPITTTGQLANIVCKALGKSGKRSRLHPATRTFQALRIAVNDELSNLERLLEAGPGVLKKDGYIAIISFHSLEDRLVKWNFKENEKRNDYSIVTKKPIVASRDEIAENRRARSAKLRIAKRL